MTDKAILEKYKNLINKLAWKVSWEQDVHDDLVSIGNTHLLKIIKKFNPSLNCSFSTFVSKRIFGRMQNELTRISWFRQIKVPLHMHYFHNGESNFVNFPELIIDADEIILNRNKHDVLINKLKKYPKIEQQLVYLKYWESYTFKEIGEKLNISESRASQLHKKILKKLGKL